jgi:hemerythrin-like metal-binding protein
MIVWDERFSVGVKKLDEQHQELFKMVGDLSENQDSAADSELLREVLERMSRHAEDHLTTEERIMMEYGYPEYASQVREHTEFKTKTARFRTDAISGKSGLAREVLDYLESWLTNHILESDLRFKDFLIDKGFLPKV